MLRFAARRTALAVITLFAISVTVFVIFFIGPANPAALMCGQRVCPPESQERINQALGLNLPAHEQYLNFVGGIFTGRTIGEGATAIECSAPCLGVSFRNSEPVLDILLRTLPITVSIVVGAAVVFLTVGIGLGMISAIKRGTVFDRTAVGTSLLFASTPVFFLGLVMMLVFVYWTGLLPRPNYVSPFDNPISWAGGMLVPWITLGLINSAIYARLSRAQMVETLSEDFVRTARAKGLPERAVNTRHAFRAAVTPLVTIAGLDIGAFLGGVVITETVFNLRGMGRTAVEAVNNLNLPIITAFVLVAAVFVVTANVVVDLLYAVIDPRVRLH